MQSEGMAKKECYMYLHQHSWHSCSRTQRPRGAATTGHGSCHLEGGERGGGGGGERQREERSKERRKVGRREAKETPGFQ